MDTEKLVKHFEEHFTFMLFAPFEDSDAQGAAIDRTYDIMKELLSPEDYQRVIDNTGEVAKSLIAFRKKETKEMKKRIKELKKEIRRM